MMQIRVFMMQIRVCYATQKKQLEIALEVEENCTVMIAIKRSGILQEFPEINLAQVCVGIYSKRTRLDSNVRNGDRIEIYRSLFRDPKQARLLRVQGLSSKISKIKN